jgi:hypothetical protein
LTVKDATVDGFWSMTIHNRDGFMEGNPYDADSINNVPAVADGSVGINLAPDGEGLTNHLYLMDGWNYAFRLGRPRPSVVDGTWSLPEIQPVGWAAELGATIQRPPSSLSCGTPFWKRGRGTAGRS